MPADIKSLPVLTDNSFFQVSSRNNVPKTHLYSTLFVDEIRLSSLLDPKKKPQPGWLNIGASRTDILIPYLTLGLEYTRINPFVYQNLIPATDVHQSGLFIRRLDGK